MRECVALGVRDGLSFHELARRAGVTDRTLRRWNRLFREESLQRAVPDRAEGAFVDLIEHSELGSRIEVVLPGERRIVINGTAIVEALARILTAVDRC
jgi:transposase-like protein